ncbi:MAG: hypothetical protein IJX57_00860, partial [Clostridia bacterium]|nr:hypothetical protein [Clostridia bacterium]
TALELIEAVVVEYNFAERALYAKSKVQDGRNYIFGSKIENVPESLIEHNVIHPSSLPVFEDMIEHIKTSEDPVRGMISMLYTGNVYKICDVMVKAVHSDGKPIKAVAVIKSTGKVIN